MKALLFPAVGLTLLVAVSHWGDEPQMLVDPVSSPIDVKADPISAPGYPYVRRVLCYAANRAGTAFRTDSGHMVSAAHVTSHDGCTVDGLPITVHNHDGDWSVIDLPGMGKGIPVNCDGFVPGKWYWAVGYANAASWQTVVPLYATVYKHNDGMRILGGLGIPGMSGGPVLNDNGQVVGIVNARSDEYGVSFSRELKDTSVCQA